MIVNDSSLLTRVYEKYLGEAGFIILGSFTSIVTLIDYIDRSASKRTFGNCVVLLDHRMPDSDSREIIEKIRSKLPSSLILLTLVHYSSDVAIQEELYDGMLRKPFSIRELLSLIESLGQQNSRETSVVVNGLEETIRVITDCINQTKDSIDACFGSDLIVELVSSRFYQELTREIEKRRLGVRLITAITHQNLSYCKDILKIPGVELRHIDEVHSKFILFDRYHVVSVVSTWSSSHRNPPRTLYSNIRSQTALYSEIFENVLQLSQPALQRIRELETEVPTTTTDVISLVQDPQESMDIRINLYRNAKASVLSWQDARRVRIGIVPELRNTIKEAVDRGVKLRLLSDIEAENVEACKERIAMGYEVRHIQDLTEGGFCANEKEYVAPVSNNDDRPLVYCTIPLLVKQQSSLFEVLWKEATPARERINEIEGERRKSGLTA